ncbi:unnamed protein product [Oppiella nova]|uniref:Uncharacterized protein n=1 Tax=Oppiella nova TaxID=334625 RepID=A0A7R9QT20_9ACAR|nr:unnamed protein product [Oppiella nova]CAG2174642.1 unnamed protein product [Oppiella nova]
MDRPFRNPFRHQYPNQHDYYYLEQQFNGNQFCFRYNRHQYHNILFPFSHTQPLYRPHHHHQQQPVQHQMRHQ